MIRRSLGLLLWTATLLSVGCRAPSPDPLERLLIQPATAEALGYTIQWQRDLPVPSDRQLASVTPLKQWVVAVDSRNLATVMADDSGATAWHESVVGPTGQVLPPVQVGDAIGLSTRTNLFLHDAQDGELRRSLSYRQLVDTTPVVKGSHVIYGSVRGSVVAQSLRSGMLEWTYQMGSRVTADPVLADGALIVCGGSGEIVAIDPKRGTRLWETSAYQEISARPAVGEKHLYVASEDHNLYAIELGTGRIRWTYPTNVGLREAPTVIGDLVLQYVPDQGIVALNREGKVQWKLEEAGNWARLQKQGDHILIHQPGRVDKILFVRRRDGKVARKVPVSKVHRIVSPTPEPGPMTVLRDGGRVMKITPAS